MFTAWFRMLALIAAAALAACWGSPIRPPATRRFHRTRPWRRRTQRRRRRRRLAKRPARSTLPRPARCTTWSLKCRPTGCRWHDSVAEKGDGHHREDARPCEPMVIETNLQKDGTGTLSIEEGNGVKQMTAVVTNDSPTKGAYATRSTRSSRQRRRSARSFPGTQVTLFIGALPPPVPVPNLVGDSSTRPTRRTPWPRPA